MLINTGPDDYTTIAMYYTYIYVTNIPKFTNATKNEAKRFISLIDQMYEYEV
jgi:predicted ATPase